MPADQPPTVHVTIEAHAPAVVVIDMDRLIRVLEMLECGEWTAPGGRLCWTPKAWAEETKLPYLLAQRAPQSRFIARQRLTRHADYLRRYNVPVTALILCCAWRNGLMGAMKRWKNGKPSDYGERGANLYADPGF